jgi:hypothetical protein
MSGRQPRQVFDAEKLIESIRRESLDTSFLARPIYAGSCDPTRARTYLASDKDAPVSRPVQRTGVVRSRIILGGLSSPLRASLSFQYTQVFAPNLHRSLIFWGRMTAALALAELDFQSYR